MKTPLKHWTDEDIIRRYNLLSDQSHTSIIGRRTSTILMNALYTEAVTRRIVHRLDGEQPTEPYTPPDEVQYG